MSDLPIRYSDSCLNDILQCLPIFKSIHGYLVTFLDCSPTMIDMWLEVRIKKPYIIKTRVKKKDWTTSFDFINYSILGSEHNWEELCIQLRSR
jgi:hypothetical protein